MEIELLPVHQSPSSLVNPIPFQFLMDEYAKYLTDVLTQHNKIMVCGDFDIHVNKENDSEASIFMDARHALALCQHITFPTHNTGNILDLLLQ